MPKPTPSIERLRACFNYDASTGVFTHALARRGVKLGSRADREASKGYRRIKLDYVDYAAHRCAWAMAHGIWPTTEIDHKDGDPSNNRIENLRQATRFEQARNTRKPDSSSNRHKGVTRVRSGKNHLWRAQIFCEGRKTYIGWYPTEELAADAYLAKAKELFGEFASTRVGGG